MPRKTQKIINWYCRFARSLPWRQTRDPYKIWISEVMLQQTQIKTAIPYYTRWIRQFPTLNHVACANEEAVLKAWEGLGYYARARNFRRACIQVMEKHGGVIPQSIQEFQALPGVGKYIAAAFYSIVHGHPVPVVDANVRRVASRLMALEKPPQEMTSEIEAFLQAQMGNERSGDFNQAMMELGETICKTRHPLCDSCPLREECIAFRKNAVDQFPKKLARKKKPHYQIAVGVIWRKQKILISKRKPEGLLGGLWEFPGGKILPGESAESCIVREIKEELDIGIAVKTFIGNINHAYTHFSITLSAFHCAWKKGTPKAISGTQFRWIRRHEIESLPFPKANHKLFPHIGARRPF
jgi:A/G-specific adenine glycosylase